MNNSVDIAFGKVEFGNPDYDFVNQLKNNNAVFAAFKAHREQNDLVPNLWDENGKLRSFNEFKQANSHIVSKYEHWLRTEYDTAVIRARNAANFQKFTRDADLYPNLEWLPSTSVEPRGEHVKFYGIVKPINDPFWSNNYPGDLWNCKCGITNTDKEPTEKTPSTDYTKPQGLEENPGTSGALFSNKNAYVKNAYDGANEAVEGFVENTLYKEASQKLKDYKNTLPAHNGIDYKSDNLVTGSIKVLRKIADDIKGHNKDYHVLNYVQKIESDLKNWKYIGWKECDTYKKGHPKEGKRKHNEADYFIYYSTKINGITRFINVMMHRDYKMETLYCITNYKEKSIKKGLPKGIKK